MSEKSSNMLKWLKKRNEEVKKNNEIFRNLKKFDKRISIALDVIDQIKAKRITPEEGTYCYVKDSKYEIPKNKQKDTAKIEMQDVFAKTESCSACALGSIFICAVERFNHFKVEVGSVSSEIYDENDKIEYEIANTEIYFSGFKKYLTKLFTGQQLADIERAFEQRTVQHEFDYNQDALQFCKNISACEDDYVGTKMRLIMENIVVNNGTFEPTENVYRFHNGRYSTPGYKQARKDFLDRVYA